MTTEASKLAQIKELVQNYRKIETDIEMYMALANIYHILKEMPDNKVYLVFKGVSLVHVYATKDEAYAALEKLASPLEGRMVEWEIEKML